MSEQLAFVFPGQGSQFVGMGKDLYESSEKARGLFDRTNAILGRNLTSIMFDGPEDALRETINTQPAILVCSIAFHNELADAGIKPAIVGGHSLGEYSALYAAGVLDETTVLRLVKLRAEVMQEAATKYPGAMAAILGLDDAQVAKICEKQEGIVVVANYNGPGQTVISGESSAVSKACDDCKAAGAKRALPLPVSGAFHSPLLEPAANVLADEIDRSDFEGPLVPVVMNVDGVAKDGAREIRDILKLQMISGVQWTRTIQAIASAGITKIVEVGPGKVLSGLSKRIDKALQSANVGTVAELQSFVKESPAQ